MRVLLCFLLTSSCLILSGCVVDRLDFWSVKNVQKHYIVTGLDDDEANAYVTSIVTDRFSKILEYEDEGELAVKRAYRQEAVRGEVLKAMHSRGYYNARVAYHDDEIGEYRIDAGDILRISRILIEPELYLGHLKDLKISTGDPLDSTKILKAQAELYKLLLKDNCTFALEVGHKVTLDPKIGKADLYFNVEEGREAVFGNVTFSGQESVKESYLKKFISWEEGDCFRHDELGTLRDRILATDLFSRVDVILPESAQEGGHIPIKIEVKERAQRSLRAGLSYYTDEGAGAVFGWEHRNFLGEGEKFNADLTLSILEQSLKASLKKPYFLRKDQSLFINASLDREDTDAYEKHGVGVGFGVKRMFSKHLSGNLGSDFEITRIKDENAKTENFALLSPRVSLTYDNRDNTLDPHEGWLLRGSVEPFIDAFGESLPFVKSKFTAQTYYEAHEKIVFATRFNMGSIIGENTEDIPATERFFAGGGGSVRGFGYQEVGPFVDGDPAGGRSLIEGSTELRLKITDTLGGVLFLDVGQVDDKFSPSFDDLSVGSGVGFRYYTDFGPLRFDVGVPLSGKDHSDQNFQIYISIGQAF